MQKESYRKLLFISIFAAAMAFLEATVVIYLRKIYYPDGFAFPLKGFIEPQILSIEWVREIGTIVMLVCIGILAGKKAYEKLAYFLYAFAVWDIFYYVWLKLTLSWPQSVFTPDLLFLIPWPWVGPVLAPVICSLTMAVLAIVIINFGEKRKIILNTLEWAFLIAGSLIILYTFLIDYYRFLTNGGFLKDFFTLAQNKEFIDKIGMFSPLNYNWIIFGIGELVILVGIFIFYRRLLKGMKSY